MKRFLITAAGLVPALLSQPAAAKLSCYPLAQIEQALHAEYGEMRRFTGRESTGIEYRLYVNAKTGSWSWIGIPAGAKIACLIFAGRAEHALPGAEPFAPSVSPEAEAQF